MESDISLREIQNAKKMLKIRNYIFFILYLINDGRKKCANYLYVFDEGRIHLMPHHFLRRESTVEESMQLLISSVAPHLFMQLNKTTKIVVSIFVFIKV